MYLTDSSNLTWISHHSPNLNMQQLHCSVLLTNDKQTYLQQSGVGLETNGLGQTIHLLNHSHLIDPKPEKAISTTMELHQCCLGEGGRGGKGRTCSTRQTYKSKTPEGKIYYEHGNSCITQCNIFRHAPHMPHTPPPTPYTPTPHPHPTHPPHVRA